MKGNEFFAQVESLKKALVELAQSLGPTTLSELNKWLSAIETDAGNADAFDKNKTDLERQQLEDRLARVREGIHNFHDGPTDPTSWMYKDYAGNVSIGWLTVLALVFTVGLLIAICLRWADATKPGTPCGSTAVSLSPNPTQTPDSAGDKKNADSASGAKAASPSPTQPSGEGVKSPESKKDSEGGATSAGKGGRSSSGGGGAAPKQNTGKGDRKPPTSPNDASKQGEPKLPARVVPSVTTLTTCQTVSLRVINANTDYTWEDPATGTIAPDGVYSAPSSITGTQTIKVYANLKAASSANQPAEKPFAIITLVPPGGPDETNVIVMVMLLGALGGCLHWISSLVIFIGNRQFLRSWVSYYLLMPFEGAALALIVYLLLRVGVLNPGTTANSASATASLNVISLYAFSGLTGNFSKQALQALGDVFNTIFKKVQAKDQPKDGTGSKS